MARLPDADDLGGLPSFDSGRPISSIDLSGIAQGGQGLARGLGIAADAFAGMAEQQRREQESREEFNLARAKTEYLVKKAELDSEVDKDTRHAGLTDDYGKGLKAIGDDASKGVTSPRALEQFALFRQENDALGLIKARDKAWNNEKDAVLAYVDAGREKLRKTALKSTDEVVRVQAITIAQGMLDNVVGRGFMSRSDAQSSHLKWVRDYAADAARNLPPEKRMEVLSKPPKGSVFEFVDETDRIELIRQAESDIRKQDGELALIERQALRGRRALLERQGYDLMLKDELTPEWLAEHHDEIGATTYKTMTKVLTDRGTSATDLDTQIHLVGLVETDPEAAVEDAAIAYRGNRISQGVFRSILSKARGERQSESPWQKDMRGFLRQSIDFGKARSTKQKEHQLNALFSFDEWLTQNPAATRAEAMKQAQEVVSDFRRSRGAEIRATAPMPQGVAASRDGMTVDDIAKAKAALLKKLRSGKIMRQDADREAAVLQRWESALQDGEDDPMFTPRPFRSRVDPSGKPVGKQAS